MVMYLIGSVVSQFVCASSVFWMTSEFSSLTVTLILTLRKFMSIVISIFYFQNDFSSQHLVGAILVFIGTMLFSDSLSRKFAFKSKTSQTKNTQHVICHEIMLYPHFNKVGYHTFACLRFQRFQIPNYIHAYQCESTM